MYRKHPNIVCIWACYMTRCNSKS